MKVKLEVLRSAMVIGSSPLMQEMMAMVEKMAPSRMPVLITGPTGSGKEVVASVVHLMGGDDHLPFVDLNCAAIPENLMESLLFGHEKGVFTGAITRHQGYFSMTGKGTLFLDEIGEMPLTQQAKLLRVIEAREYRPLGSVQSYPFEGRIVAATHANLETLVAKGRFREDLYYRLNVLQVAVPSLDERRVDIPEFVAYFMSRVERPVSLSLEAVKLLCQINWPGNVRQLKSTIEKIALLSDKTIVSAKEVRRFLHQGPPPVSRVFETIADQVIGLPCDNKVDRMESALVKQALKRAGGNKSEAARSLGVHRKYVERRVKA